MFCIGFSNDKDGYYLLRGMTPAEFKKATIQGFFTGIILLFFAFALSIDSIYDIEHVIYSAETFDENGELKTLVKESLSDKSISLVEKFQIYFEVDNQIELSEQNHEKNILNSFLKE